MCSQILRLQDAAYTPGWQERPHPGIDKAFQSQLWSKSSENQGNVGFSGLAFEPFSNELKPPLGVKVVRAILVLAGLLATW